METWFLRRRELKTGWHVDFLYDGWFTIRVDAPSEEEAEDKARRMLPEDLLMDVIGIDVGKSLR